MRTITFTIEARQPLLLTSLQGDPNSSVSFDYIPGSVIRGAMIAAYQRSQLGGAILDATVEEVQRLFFDGNTRYLNGYILSVDGRRSLPLPRSLVRDKEGGDESLLYDLSRAVPADLTPAPARIAYGTFDPRGNLSAAEVRRRVQIHNQRDRQRGRGVESSGALFRYEAIAAGQRFGAAILCDTDQDAPELEKLLKGHILRLGGSRNAGYGEVELGDIKTHQTWPELAPPPAQRPLGPELRLTLISDLLARDAYGQPSLEPPLGEIERLLGVTVQEVVVERSFRATTIHGGFNRTWGLPLPQRAALVAGSIFVLRCDRAPTADAVADLEWHGLGERRAEGFGRVAVAGPPQTAKVRLGEPAQPTATSSQLPPDSPSRTLAREMARHLLTQRLETELIRLCDEHRILGGEIANTQLSRLRIVARRALGDKATERMRKIHDLIDTLPSNAREQYARARVGRSEARLYDWLQERISDPFTDWERNRLGVEIAGERVELDEQLATRYTLRLIMAVARLKVKEAA